MVPEQDEAIRNDCEIKEAPASRSRKLALYAWAAGTLWGPFIYVVDLVFKQVEAIPQINIALGVSPLGLLALVIIGPVVAIVAATQLEFKVGIRILLAIPAFLMFAYHGLLMLICLMLVEH